jgi:diguanylate cyclase (GGDEF)-like protein
VPTDRETSPATTRLLLEYVRDRAGERGMQDVVAASGVPESLGELLEESRWVSYDTRIRLFEAATECLGDPQTMLHVGSAALRAGMPHASLVALLRALGSPRQVFRSLPRAVAKFTTTSTMEVVETGRSHAAMRYTLHEGYLHSRLDCLYAQGLFSVVPEIFGLPAARIVHDECESDGAAACVYHVTWGRRPWRKRDAQGTDEVDVLRQQLAALQDVASDLVGTDRLEDVLQRIAERAASAVVAPGYLLAVEDPNGGPPLVFSTGLEDERARELAARLLAGEYLGRSAVVAPVESSRRRHGWLAALNGDGLVGLADEERMLGAYARQAAVALDLLVAMDSSRRGEERARDLLGLAHQLSAAAGTAQVAAIVAEALPRVVGSPLASVMLWDSSAGELRAAAAHGLAQAPHDLLMSTPLRPEDAPELMEMLAKRQPRVLHASTTGAVLSELLRAVDTATCLVVPLLAGDELLGVATAGWPAEAGSIDDVTERTARLAGVADQAATALMNARLLETVKHQSLHDDLTGLPNRVLFGDRLEQALRACPDGSAVAVLFCDLDRFKQVNDVLGHAAGDELLRQVAMRLRGCLRPGDSVGRLSGDEFSLLLPGVPDLAAAEAVAQRVVWSFDSPFRIDGRELRVTTSVGVAAHAGPGGRGDRLLRAADAAMYTAKQRGRNQICLATGTPVHTAHTPPSLEKELIAGVDHGQLRLHFQPIVADGHVGRPVGAEALLRWQHPRLGILPPAAFLPLAEESSLVVDLDLWALREACAAAARWRSEGDPVQVSVNLSSRTVGDPRLASAVRSALAAADLPPHLLCLEIVESQSLLDLPALSARLQELRQMGVHTALDDFGTGYSTLSWLQRLPVDRIKLDRSFIAELPDAAATVLVRGIVALATELGIGVVAEGVETAEQLDALSAAGCRHVQGYLLGRPAPELVRTAVAVG